MYQQRFDLIGPPLPQNASGRTFSEPPGFDRLDRRFAMLAREPGLGVLTGEAGLGKTTGMRHLTEQLPRPDYQVVYMCDTQTSPLDFYRQLAYEFGLTPSHRRAQLWHDLKAAIVQLVDEQNTRPVIVVDEAQHLSDRFLCDLSGFLNFAFDSRNLIVFWLIGQPPLRKRLKMKQHAALASRVVARVHLEPLTDRQDFVAFLEAGLKAAGAQSNLVSEPAAELLFRASGGVTRVLARLLHEALYLADEKDQNFVDDTIVEAVLDDEVLQ
jgi:type II secretory pathway predicted ATPase ExeA